MTTRPVKRTIDLNFLEQPLTYSCIRGRSIFDYPRIPMDYIRWASILGHLLAALGSVRLWYLPPHLDVIYYFGNFDRRLEPLIIYFILGRERESNIFVWKNRGVGRYRH